MALSNLWNRTCILKEFIKIKLSSTLKKYRVATVLSLDNGDTTINSYDIASTFNNYIASMAETTKKSIEC